MFTQYFGNYLLNKGYLTAEQLHDALEEIKDARLKLGVLAVNAGYMTAEQTEEVNEAQKKYDKRFGELAIEMGYLTEEQLKELLSSQKYGHLLLSQVLVDKGIMTLSEFEKAINEYKRDYSISDKEFEAIQSDDVNEIINIFIKFEGSKNEKLLKDYIALFARNLIRFIDRDAVIKEVSKLEVYDCQFAAKQDVSGAIVLTTYIEADENAFIQFASKYAEEELSSVDEMAEASVGEFLNLHNGIFLVNLSNQGIELKMTPQEVFKDIKVEKLFKVSAELSFGCVNILIQEH